MGVIGSAGRWIRRIQRLLFLASIAAGVYRWWQSGPGRRGGGGGGSGRRAPIGGPQSPSALRAAAPPQPEPELVGATNAPLASVTLADNGDTAPDAVQTLVWVEPLDDGSCPSGHPIKANDSSGIYHVPGGRFYDRTVAVRCYASPEAASADGYRAAKA